MTDKLPPLPHCCATEKTPTIDRRGVELVCLYTADQMRAYATAARAQALEDAARAIETQDTNGDHVGGWFALLAAKVRAMKGTP